MSTKLLKLDVMVRLSVNASSIYRSLSLDDSYEKGHLRLRFSYMSFQAKMFYGSHLVLA